MEKVLKIGIMGLIRGSSFAKSLHLMKDVELTAVCEVSDETLEQYKDCLWEQTVVYRDFDEFIHSGIDAVILCNFFHEHGKYAIRAMKAGVAVLSETTAAPSLGECVDLVETQEATGVPYMLAANVIYYKAVHALKKELEKGDAGKVLYADAEYIHGSPVDMNAVPPEIDMENLHWRQTMPCNMYNMHTLGPLMYVTGSMPRKVTCKMIRDAEYARMKKKVHDCVGSVVVTEMDNGAVFNTTGCSYYPPTTKWFRIACRNQTLETVRNEITKPELIVTGEEGSKHIELDEYSAGLLSEDENVSAEDIAACSHNGVDYYNIWRFLQYLRGERDIFFNVYRAAALSAVGILGWYSALMDSRQLDIPDFSKKEDRDAVRGDYRIPIAKRYEDLAIPCRLDEKDKFVR